MKASVCTCIVACNGCISPITERTNHRVCRMALCGHVTVNANMNRNSLILTPNEDAFHIAKHVYAIVNVPILWPASIWSGRVHCRSISVKN